MHPSVFQKSKSTPVSVRISLLFIILIQINVKTAVLKSVHKFGKKSATSEIHNKFTIHSDSEWLIWIIYGCLKKKSKCLPWLKIITWGRGERAPLFVYQVGGVAVEGLPHHPASRCDQLPATGTEATLERGHLSPSCPEPSNNFPASLPLLQRNRSRWVYFGPSWTSRRLQRIREDNSSESSFLYQEPLVWSLDIDAGPGDGYFYTYSNRSRKGYAVGTDWHLPSLSLFPFFIKRVETLRKMQCIPSTQSWISQRFK